MSANFRGATKNKFDVNEINALARTNPASFVADSEKRYADRVKRLADEVLSKDEKIIFIAGPSASGKTTTSEKLAKLLFERGKKSLSISLDDFLLGIDSLPRFDDGSIDFESINTLDIECFHACINGLIERNSAMFPRFDFIKQRRSRMERVEIEEGTVVIVEGIHALNPLITDSKYAKRFLKVYISVKSEYYANGNLILPSRDLRLVRRLIRDYHFRGSSAENTLDMWDKVCLGEDMYIKPFREMADIWLDSTHLYEPLIYSHYLIPVLSEIDKDSKHYEKATKTAATLKEFGELDKSIVPADSMLREFIGQ